LPQVEGEVLLDGVADHAEASHQVGRRAVPVRRTHLRGENVLVVIADARVVVDGDLVIV
jgi:hypothetical protein